MSIFSQHSLTTSLSPHFGHKFDEFIVILHACQCVFPLFGVTVLFLLCLENPYLTSNSKSKCCLFCVVSGMSQAVSTPCSLILGILCVWFSHTRALQRQTQGLTPYTLSCQHFQEINILSLPDDLDFHNYFKPTVSFDAFHKFVKHYTADIIPI